MIKKFCDLCGQPIETACVKYRVEKRTWKPFNGGSTWKQLDVHESCAEKMFNSAKTYGYIDDDE